MSNRLPTLYKRTSTGATQTWRVDVDGATIITTYGQKDGKLQTARDTITSGKNIGKSNETTPEQQAELEAVAQWEKKAKKGYVLSVDDAQAGVVDSEFISGGINPMLAQSYSKHASKIVYPAFVQPKLDGHRCIAMRTDGVWTLWSRTRKPITGVPHIIEALAAQVVGDGSDLILDGELYNHDYRDKFEELTSFIKRPDPKEGHEVVQYHIYDMVRDVPFEVRESILGALGALIDDPLVIVETHRVFDFEAAQVFFADFLDQGYEGAMLRNANSPYVQKRSYDLQKLKEFDDAEFLIVDVEEGRGKLAGRGIFVCETPAGDTFSVKLKGSLDNLDLDTLRKNIGDMLTVQFQGYTAYGIPRFPIGLRVREDV